MRSPLESIINASPDSSAKRRRSVTASASTSAPPVRTEMRIPLSYNSTRGTHALADAES